MIESMVPASKDKYDIAIEFLTKHPEHIENAWFFPAPNKLEEVNQAHCLFQVVGDCNNFGCLTQIKYYAQAYKACTPELTEQIIADERIPNSHLIKVTDLPIFAEWQRRLDKELNRC